MRVRVDEPVGGGLGVAGVGPWRVADVVAAGQRGAEGCGCDLAVGLEEQWGKGRTEKGAWSDHSISLAFFVRS